jgi:hypothetical protein
LVDGWKLLSAEQIREGGVLFQDLAADSAARVGLATGRRRSMYWQGPPRSLASALLPTRRESGALQALNRML